MKLSIIYDSKTGNTKQAAEWIAEGMNSIEGIEAKAFYIQEADHDFIKESKGFVAGSPSYMAQMTPDLHNWLFQNGAKDQLAGKLGGAFSTEQYTHGGGSVVLQSILNFEMVLGMLCYSGGNAYGKPCIHLGPVGVNGNVEKYNSMENYKEYFKIYGSRFATKAKEIF